MSEIIENIEEKASNLASYVKRNLTLLVITAISIIGFSLLQQDMKALACLILAPSAICLNSLMSEITIYTYTKKNFIEEGTNNVIGDIYKGNANIILGIYLAVYFTLFAL